MSTSIEKLEKQNKALLKLAKSSAIDSGNLKQALREITEAASLTLEVQRSSVWAYNETKDAIVCLDLYEAKKGEHSEGIILKAKDFPAYFQYLKEERSLPAHDAHTDPSTFEFSECYLKPLGINSMLDAPFRRAGEMMGVICNEHVGPKRVWTIEEQNFAGSLADLISRAFEAEARAKAEEELRRANELLEEKVIERTRELTETLEQVKALKEKQDADYFLTSLLINPLSVIEHIKAENLTLESLLVQKKQFIYRDRVYQIGGDFVYGKSVSLMGVPHIFLINADAMGKSIQGAGGAIVLGSVLRVLLSKNSIKQETSPSKYLGSLYKILNDVFSSFDGSMTVSFSMALISPENLAYIICGEHPAPVIFRDQKASLVRVNQMPKLGSKRDDVKDIPISVNRLQLYSGDALILASDGRDDILVKDKVGNVYNDDENLFCKHVEATGGDLNQILQEISSVGELTDDFSAVKLSIK